MREFKRDWWLPVAPLLPNDFDFSLPGLRGISWHAWLSLPSPTPPDLTTSPLHHHDPLVKPRFLPPLLLLLRILRPRSDHWEVTQRSGPPGHTHAAVWRISAGLAELMVRFHGNLNCGRYKSHECCGSLQGCLKDRKWNKGVKWTFRWALKMAQCSMSRPGASLDEWTCSTGT